MSRTPICPTESTLPVSFSLPASQHDALVKFATEVGVTRADVIRLALREFLDNAENEESDKSAGESAKQE